MLFLTKGHSNAFTAFCGALIECEPVVGVRVCVWVHVGTDATDRVRELIDHWPDWSPARCGPLLDIILVINPNLSVCSFFVARILNSIMMIRRCTSTHMLLQSPSISMS
jgi:hypothetical protein